MDLEEEMEMAGEIEDFLTTDSESQNLHDFI